MSKSPPIDLDVNTSVLLIGADPRAVPDIIGGESSTVEARTLILDEETQKLNFPGMTTTVCLIWRDGSSVPDLSELLDHAYDCVAIGRGLRILVEFNDAFNRVTSLVHAKAHGTPLFYPPTYRNMGEEIIAEVERLTGRQLR
mgnify:CR=1 FL=1